jgi:hypothetical protein
MGANTHVFHRPIGTNPLRPISPYGFYSPTGAYSYVFLSRTGTNALRLLFLDLLAICLRLPYIGMKAIYVLVTRTLGYLVIFIRIRAYNYRRYYCLYRSAIAAISISTA